MTGQRWMLRGVVTLVLAAGLHVAVVTLIPFTITTTFMARAAKDFGTNRAVALPLPTDTSRAVVKPSPDLLYAVCIFDVAQGPMRVSVVPPDTYWSLSLFDRNSDNFFKLGESDVKDGRVEFVLVAASQHDAGTAKFPADTIVEAPGTSGVLLGRFLVLDATKAASAEAAQRSVRCEFGTW